MKKYFLLFLFPVMVLLSGCDLLNPDGNGNDVLVQENITVPTTWTADKVWKIETDIYVESDLVIEPGTVISFAQNVGIYVGYDAFASISALGTEEDPILFTSASSNKEPGDWKGIYFSESNSASGTKFTWCTFEYGGGGYEYSGMLELYETAVSMSHCTVRMAQNNGIALYYDSEFTLFTSNKIEDCGRHCLTCDAIAVGTIASDNLFSAESGFGIQTGGYIEKNATWYTFTVPYYLAEDLVVESESGEVHWTISPGVTIKCGPGHYIWIGYSYFAKVTANGSAEQPITFTSAASSPSRGDWDALVLGQYTSNSSLLNYCNIWYSGGDGYGAVYVDGENNRVTISNCNIAHSAGSGIYIWYADPVLLNNTFEDNDGTDVHIEE